jgi:hypothetical protein
MKGGGINTTKAAALFCSRLIGRLGPARNQYDHHTGRICREAGKAVFANNQPSND